MSTFALDRERLAAAKPAYTTRFATADDCQTLLDGDLVPAPGDLVLARVDRIGHHARLERPGGRKAAMFTGDEVLVCYGNRYAPDQFEAEVPPDLLECDLVAAGGVAARALSWRAGVKPPTALTPIGLVGDRDGRRLNLRRWALPLLSITERPPVVAVIGTSMNAGKTTTAATTIRGLTAAGLKVGAAKITGTGAGGDAWLMTDAGAGIVLDFTDAGFASTYLLSTTHVIGIAHTLIGQLTAAGVDAIVLEVADGVFQSETASLLASEEFAALVDRVLFAAGDAVGAVAGVARLEALGLPVHGVAGLLTASPLAVREAQANLAVKVFDLPELGHPSVAETLLSRARPLIAVA